MSSLFVNNLVKDLFDNYTGEVFALSGKAIYRLDH
jgi:hypothetical protein